MRLCRAIHPALSTSKQAHILVMALPHVNQARRLPYQQSTKQRSDSLQIVAIKDAHISMAIS
jgi:hypothetical protein